MYDGGVQSADSPRFKTTFEDVYTGSALQTPWYILAGNHDHDGNVSAQLIYAKTSRRWNFPQLYYTVKYELADGTTVDYVLYDTNTLCESLKKKADKFEDEQWDWLKETLMGSTADYLFVLGHYPVWSLGGNGPTKCLENDFRDLLHKARVSAYFAGHDHSMQHIRDDKKGWFVDYFVAGGGAVLSDKTTHKKDLPKDSLQFHYPDFERSDDTPGGFIYTSLYKDVAVFNVYRGDGERLHRTAVFPRN